MPKGVASDVSKGKGVPRRLDVGASDQSPDEPSTSSGITHRGDTKKSLSLRKIAGLIFDDSESEKEEDDKSTKESASEENVESVSVGERESVRPRDTSVRAKRQRRDEEEEREDSENAQVIDLSFSGSEHVPSEPDFAGLDDDDVLDREEEEAEILFVIDTDDDDDDDEEVIYPVRARRRAGTHFR